MARMRSMMPGGGQLPAGTGIDPEQLSRMMQAMSRPLSPPETLAVIDEMAEIGFLPKAMQSELKECMVLLPAAAPALGMGMGMLKPMLPQLRQARDQLHALSPASRTSSSRRSRPDMKELRRRPQDLPRVPRQRLFSEARRRRPARAARRAAETASMRRDGGVTLPSLQLLHPPRRGQSGGVMQAPLSFPRHRRRRAPPRQARWPRCGLGLVAAFARRPAAAATPILSTRRIRLGGGPGPAAIAFQLSAGPARR